MDLYRVIIASTKQEEARMLRSALEETEQFTVEEITDDGLACVRLAMLRRPDLILIDLALYQMDGLEAIRRIKCLLPVPPVILMLTSGPRNMCEQAISAGARAIFLRPCDPHAVAARALELLTPPAARISDEEIDLEVWRICTALGAPVHLRGFRCVRTGVRLIVRDEGYLDRITDRLYPAIKDACCLTGNVEKNIRDFIGKLFQNNDPETLASYVGILPGEGKVKPTNSAFLAALANRVLHELQHQDHQEQPYQIKCS